MDFSKYFKVSLNPRVLMLEDARLTSFLEYSTNECDDIFQMLIISRAIELISLISGLESFNKKLLNVKLTSQ